MLSCCRQPVALDDSEPAGCCFMGADEREAAAGSELVSAAGKTDQVGVPAPKPIPDSGGPETVAIPETGAFAAADGKSPETPGILPEEPKAAPAPAPEKPKA